MTSVGFSNGTMFADNVDFTGSSESSIQPRVTTNGQLLIGSSVAPNIRVATLTAGPGVSITNGNGSIAIGLSGGGTGIDSLAVQGGTSPVTPDSNGLITLNGSGSTTTTGSLNTVTVELTGLTNHNLLIGAGTTTITKVAPSATSGVPVISQGASADPTFGTAVVAGGGTGQVTLTNHGVLIGQATSPVAATAAGTAGQVLQSGGASADPTYSTATYPTTASTSGNVITSDGTNFTSAAPASSMLITTYNTADSPATWTKDSRTKEIEVWGWAGGGGGGSGRKGATTTSGGGSGGGPGGSFYFRCPASVLNTTESVVIGAGGSGGSSQSGDLADGNPGIGGGNTSFGNWLCLGGNLGGGGINGTSSGGSGRGNITMLAILPSTPTGGAGRVTTGVIGSTFGPGGTSPQCLSASGGGGGGGGDAVTERVGAIGGSMLNISASVMLAGGTAGLESTGINGGNGNVFTTGGILSGGSGGGGGGGYSVGALGATTGGIGGNGALPGGGGGGGGGGLSAVANSGAGGNGANGRVVVIEYF